MAKQCLQIFNDDLSSVKALDKFSTSTVSAFTKCSANLSAVLRPMPGSLAISFTAVSRILE
jgi:hypothetical protein